MPFSVVVVFKDEGKVFYFNLLDYLYDDVLLCIAEWTVKYDRWIIPSSTRWGAVVSSWCWRHLLLQNATI